MRKYIEWDLENNPQFFQKPQSGKFVDTGVLRHVICNVNKPENVSEADFKIVLEAVAGEVDLIPATAIAPHLISPIGLNPGDIVWLEMYDHSKGQYFVVRVTVKWLDENGICFVDDNGWGSYGKIDDFNEGWPKATFGWRCWDFCPTDAKRKVTPWST